MTFAHRSAPTAPTALAAALAVFAATYRCGAADAGAAAALDASAPDAASVDAGVSDVEVDTTADGGSTPDGGTPERVWASCMESIPAGATRPTIEETFPARGWSGYALPLHLVIRHGRGETVLPNGFHVQRDSDAARAVDNAGFVFPSPDGGSAPSLVRRDDGEGAVTDVTIPFVALPPKAGRHELTLPPVPIAVSRASGDLVTVCTAPHTVTLDDPTANETAPDPKGNPEPRRQREEWTVARDVSYGLLIGGAAAALLTWLALRWLRRPRALPPPPPPRPPWELALEELGALRRSNLLESGQFAEHVDRVSDATRRYLGALYAFDGIESTTDEVMTSLEAVAPPLPQLATIRSLLGECDLVKFARWTPTSEDCVAMIDRAERLVHETMQGALASPAQPPAPASPQEVAR